MKLQQMKIILLLTKNIYSQCTNPIVKKEIRDMSFEEISKFKLAMRLISNRKDGPSLGDFSKFHNKLSKEIHFNLFFLPWHRAFIHRFETELRKLVDGVVIPYWDWTLNSQSPETDSIFEARYMGGNGRSVDNCVTTGDFKIGNFTVFEDLKGSCLKRKFNRGNKISAFSSPDILSQIMNIKDFYDFSTSIEMLPHGSPHVGIGATMESMYAPNDPLFWLHHSFIDKLWYQWQGNKQKTHPYKDYNLPGFNSPLINFINPRGDTLCYKYLEYSAVRHFTGLYQNLYYTDKFWGGYLNSKTLQKMYNHSVESHILYTAGDSSPIRNLSQASDKTLQMIVDMCRHCPDPDDRSDQKKLRPSMPLPKKWLKMNNINHKRVEEEEFKATIFVNGLNNINYQSPSNLENSKRLTSIPK